MSIALSVILPGGDPTVSGWLIAIGYALALGACLWALRAARAGARLACRYHGPERRRRTRRRAYRAANLFWIILATGFLVLGLNTQLDLHAWLTDLGRSLAEAQGWYQERRAYQAMFVILLAVGGLVTLGWMMWRVRPLLPRTAMALVGLVFLACFAVLRASSFHDIDAVMGFPLAGLKLRMWLEALGLLLVGGCAVRSAWWYRDRRLSRSSVREPRQA